MTERFQKEHDDHAVFCLNAWIPHSDGIQRWVYRYCVARIEAGVKNEDSERLDWLEKSGAVIMKYPDKSLRETIDEVRAASERDYG